MRDIPTSPRIAEIKRKKKAHFVRLSILCFVLLITVIGALSYFSSNEKITINDIKIEGTNIIDSGKVTLSINTMLSGKYIYLFSKKNSFIYPKEYIYNNLISQYPRIQELIISRDSLNSLSVRIKERSGAYLYCGVSVPQDLAQIGENCYFVNDDGYIFDKAPYFSGNVYFKFYLNINNNQIDPQGLQMLPTNKFHSLVLFVDKMIDIGFDPTYLVVDDDWTYHLYLNHKAIGTTPEIMFKESNNLETISDNLSLSMKQREFANEINTKYDKLLYIDLRFDNKVLYKFQ